MFFSTRSDRPNKLKPAATALAAILAVVMLAVTVISTGPTADADVDAFHSTLISENASFLTPGVVDGRVEAITVAGDTVYVGGTFTQIQEVGEGAIIDQPYLFAYSKSTGAILTDFDPVLNNEVWALETTADGSSVFAGGAFTIVNGSTNKKGLTKLDQNGDRVIGFAGRTDARVKTMVRLGTTLFIGGTFNQVGSTPVENLAAIDTTTGLVIPTIDFDFAGPLSTTRVTGTQSVDEIDVTSDGSLLVVVGNFSSIDGISRHRLAVIELGGTATVSTWNTDVFDVQCPASKFPQYILGMDIAPDNSYFVTGTTGFRIVDDPACDSILRFELDNLGDSDVQPTWSNYTGGDSVYEVAASEHAVYAGGHFRWLNNPYSVDGRSAGPGAVTRLGMAALDPLNGMPLNWRSDRNPRGRGTFALLIENEGLYIGDDTDFINGSKHAKLKFLPVTGVGINRPERPSLPTTIFNFDGNSLDGISFDGSTFGTPNELVATSNIVGAMFLGGQLFTGQSDGTMWVRRFEGGALGARSSVNMYGITNSQWDLSKLGGMYYDHDQGRVYYTQTDDNRLFYRAFSPEGPLFGTEEFLAADFADVPWADVRGMDVVNGQLYFGRTNGNLYRATMNGSTPVAGTTVQLSGPGLDGRNWNGAAMSFFSGGELFPPSDVAEFEFENAGSETVKSFKVFEFPVTPGEPVTVKLEWDDPNAEMNVWLRDETGQTIDGDSTPTGPPKWLTAPAGNGGTYSVAIKIKEGSTAYRVLVNPVEPPPAPRAEFEFTDGGTATDGAFKTFKFPVVAGERVDATVEWADPAALVNVFLRDETGAKIESDVDGSASPAVLSTTAATTGEWSVAVHIKGGATNYDVLVDTTDDGTPPPTCTNGGADILPDGTIEVAPENGTVTLDLPNTVYYGAADCWIAQSYGGGTVPCTNAEFGDPLVGTVKACRIIEPDPEPECPLVQQAEDGVLFGDFVRVADADAQAGFAIHAPEGTGTTYDFGTSATRAEYCFDVDEAGTYAIRARGKGTGGTSDSFFVTLNGNPAGGAIWDLPGDWSNDIIAGRNIGQLTFNLAPGEQKATFWLREDGSLLDRVELVKLDDAPPEPTCPLELEAEDAELRNNFQIWDIASARNGQAIVAPEGVGTTYTFGSSTQAEFCFEVLEDGLYEIEARAASGPDSGSNSFFVTLDGAPANGAIWDLPVTNQFETLRVSDRNTGTLQFSLAPGVHSVIFHLREDGSFLDWARLVRVG